MSRITAGLSLVPETNFPRLGKFYCKDGFDRSGKKNKKKSVDCEEMSRRTKTEKSDKTDKSERAAFVVTAEQTGKEAAPLPFPEWADLEVNAEKWETQRTKV